MSNPTTASVREFTRRVILATTVIWSISRALHASRVWSDVPSLDSPDANISVSPFCFAKEVTDSISIPSEIRIHDTTLREGEQTPGVVFSPQDKLAIARKLDQVGIQQIESGFPVASQGERMAVRLIAREGLEARIFGFARAVPSDIEAVAECDAFGVVLSFPPSDIHLKYKLKMTRKEYLAKAVQAVELAKKHGLYVTYSAEDSTRADLDFLKRIFNEIARAGANTVRVVDTVGAITPLAMRYLVREIRKAVDIPVEIHCHNDHGLALANTLAALEEGASVISSSIDGLGERAGLAATEEIIITLHNLYGIRSFNTKSLFELCKLVENLSRIKISPNKPVVGENVFAHTTGIHQHGVLENPTTYESYPPELVGRERSLLLGKLSGTHAVVHKLHALGYNASREKVTEVLAAVKEMSEKRRSALSDSEFAEIAQQVLKKRKDES